MQALENGRSRPSIDDIVAERKPRTAHITTKGRHVGLFFKGYDRCTPFYYILNPHPLFRLYSKLLPRYLVLSVAPIETCVRHLSGAMVMVYIMAHTLSYDYTSCNITVMRNDNGNASCNCAAIALRDG